MRRSNYKQSAHIIENIVISYALKRSGKILSNNKQSQVQQNTHNRDVKGNSNLGRHRQAGWPALHPNQVRRELQLSTGQGGKCPFFPW